MQELVFRLLMWSPLAIVAFVYPLTAYMVLNWTSPPWRDGLFAFINLLGAFSLCVGGLVGPNHDPSSFLHLTQIVALGFCAYLAFVAIQFVLIRSSRSNAAWLVAAWYPIVVLAGVKYLLPSLGLFKDSLAPIGIGSTAALFLGLSYMSFRLCRLVQEVRNEQVAAPRLAAFLSFAFFVPTLTVGPISPFQRFIVSYQASRSTSTNWRRPTWRILLGLTKYFAFSPILGQFTYGGLILDGHPHHLADLIIASPAYTLYLYCNFSGYCDIAIGVSGLIGIDVMENFDAPLLSRNMQVFWNKWHISLSIWLRDLMFTPLVKGITRRMGPQFYMHSVALSIIIVFLVIGVWHGSGINFALFGLSQGVSLAIVHYYTVYLKRRLGKQRYNQYMNSVAVRIGSTAFTFLYFSVSLSLLANNLGELLQITRVVSPG